MREAEGAFHGTGTSHLAFSLPRFGVIRQPLKDSLFCDLVCVAIIVQGCHLQPFGKARLEVEQ